MKQKMPKPTDEVLLHHARKAGVEEYYLKHRSALIDMLDKCTEEGQGDLAGFLFAITALSNEVGRRHSTHKRR